jgi:YihY family inner membrane protein
LRRSSLITAIVVVAAIVPDRGGGFLLAAAAHQRGSPCRGPGSGPRIPPYHRWMVRRALALLRSSITSFHKNQGFLLASAVAYNALLSIVPLFTVLLVALSHLVDERLLLEGTDRTLRMIIPGRTAVFTVQLASFIENRRLIGVVSGVMLLFFSSIAFTVLENAVSVIFFHRVAVRRRRFFVSAIIPYLFIVALGGGLLLITIAGGALEVLGQGFIHVGHHVIPLAGLSGVALYLGGDVGLVLLLTALYLVMPVGRMPVSHALLGGIIATALWEIVRRVLVWYFATLSMVNVLYGSMATAIVVLLTFEAGALILLFGAQVIAEVEKARLEREAGPGGDGEAHFD